ncbi:hypothetical protein A2U01_0056631 [Trifolium medium]|uniref:Uncharacterized protein n=1 Tax=Trifolium medium TaxID=97028 RepID=A0A392RHZ6_9FABA|nr:hypothetical protein [Trifolium medium]
MPKKAQLNNYPKYQPIQRDPPKTDPKAGKKYWKKKRNSNQRLRSEKEKPRALKSPRKKVPESQRELSYPSKSPPPPYSQ